MNDCVVPNCQPGQTTTMEQIGPIKAVMLDTHQKTLNCYTVKAMEI